jgi:hypothetical protein
MYRIKNNEKISKRRKIYREKNKLKRNEYCRNRKRDDIQFKLQCSIRSRLVGALKDCAKSGSAVRDLGCTIPELKVHIEKQFQQGMTWDNWNKTTIDQTQWDSLIPGD